MKKISASYIWPFLKPYQRQLLIGPLFKWVEAMLELLLPTMMSLLIDNGVRQQDFSYVLRVGGWMLLTAVVGVLSALVCQYSASVASQGFGTGLRNALFARLNRMSLPAVERWGASSLTNRLTNDVNTMQQGVAMLIRLVVRAPFLCIGGFVMAASIDAQLALVVLAGIVLFTLCITIIMRRSVPLYRLVQERLDVLSRILRENLSGVRVIRAFARSKHERQRFGKQNSAYRTAAERVGRIAAALNPLTLLILNLATVAVLGLGGVSIDSGRMSPGQIIAFINYLVLILQALLVVATLVQLYTRVFASLARVNEMMQAEPESSGQGRGAAAQPGELRFEGVSFAYGKHADNALEGIDFTLPPGGTLGIIGGTGSGKSTLVQLIARLYDVTEGSIVWQGQDIRQWNIEQLRGQIGMALQKPLLFSGTVAENIRWGKQDASQKELQQAAKAAQAADFIENMPDGYQSHVERGGANLSGGQKQRLSIARALVRKPRLLILDDSASALDYQTEARLRAALKEYQRAHGMSVITISQRIASVRHAERILLLEEGKCVGYGDHDTLRQENAIYQELCALQAIAPEEDHHEA